MKINKLGAMILAAFLALLLTACEQKIDATLYENQSWEVRSTIHYKTDAVQMAEKYLPQLLEQLGEPFDKIVVDLDDADGQLVESGLETLVAYYGSLAIDVRYERLNAARANERTYEIVFSGRSYDSFTALAPELISLTEVIPNEQYSLAIHVGDVNVFSRALYKQDVVFHAGQIINSNAPRQEAQSAEWPNPKSILVEFVPAPLPPTPVPLSERFGISNLFSTDGRVSAWKVLGGLALLVMIVAAITFFVTKSRRPKPGVRPTRQPTPHRKAPRRPSRSG